MHIRDAVKRFFVAQSASELAQKIYNRKKELADNRVSARNDLEQARNNAIIFIYEL